MVITTRQSSSFATSQCRSKEWKHSLSLSPVLFSSSLFPPLAVEYSPPPPPNCMLFHRSNYFIAIFQHGQINLGLLLAVCLPLKCDDKTVSSFAVDRVYVYVSSTRRLRVERERLSWSKGAKECLECAATSSHTTTLGKHTIDKARHGYILIAMPIFARYQVLLLERR